MTLIHGLEIWGALSVAATYAVMRFSQVVKANREVTDFAPKSQAVPEPIGAKYQASNENIPVVPSVPPPSWAEYELVDGETGKPFDPPRYVPSGQHPFFFTQELQRADGFSYGARHVKVDAQGEPKVVSQ